jgi:sortase B
MTVSYNKRPRVRGKVHESLKSGSAVSFIEWTEPASVISKFLVMLAGFIPFAGLSLYNWLAVEGFGKSKLDLIVTMTDWGDTFNFVTINNFDERVQYFDSFKWILLISGGLLAFSLLLVTFSMICSSTRARNPLAITGFSLGALSPLVFIIAMNHINHPVVEGAIQPTLFSYLSFATGLLALIYCVKYPALGGVRNRRNSVGTRMLTSFVPVRGDDIREGVRKVIFTAALVSFIYFGSTLGVDLFNEWRAGVLQRQHQDRVGADFDPNDPRVIERRQSGSVAPLDKYMALWLQNNDFVGWVRVGDTAVNYPVVQGNDNRYYLDFDFEHNRSKGGAIFADHRNRFEGLDISDNTVLFGHNIATGNYFAALSNYWSTTNGFKSNDLSFYKQHPVINFDTMYEELEWKVFAVGLYNADARHGEVYEYWRKHDFHTADEFHEFVFDVMDRSVLFTDVDLRYGDKLLTLSTCFYPMGMPGTPGGVNSRVVVFARQVRAGESSYVDTSVAANNSNVLRWTEEARRYGQGWNGRRMWDYRKYLTSYEE